MPEDERCFEQLNGMQCLIANGQNNGVILGLKPLPNPLVLSGLPSLRAIFCLQRLKIANKNFKKTRVQPVVMHLSDAAGNVDN